MGVVPLVVVVVIIVVALITSGGDEDTDGEQAVSPTLEPTSNVCLGALDIHE